MVGASEVQALNSRIEKINVQRTKAETRSEMLKKQLEDELVTYASNFGVDLKGKDFAATQVKVNAELRKVLADVEAEYKLKEQVVTAIENGEYEQAYQLLGIERKQQQSVEQEQVSVPEFTEAVKESEAMKIEEPVVGDDEEEFSMPTPSATMLDDVGVDVPKSKITSQTVGRTLNQEMGQPVEMTGCSPKISFQSDLVVEEEQPSGNITKEKTASGSQRYEKQIKGTSVESAMSDLVVEDDDDIPNLEDADFGFGSILQGTKFSGSEE